jgi:hypothetical protein
MPSVHSVPLLLLVLVALLLALIGWGLWQGLRRTDHLAFARPRDDLLTGVLVVAAFVLGVFLAYSLLILIDK